MREKGIALAAWVVVGIFTALLGLAIAAGAGLI